LLDDHNEVTIAVDIKIAHRERTLQVSTGEVVAQDRLQAIYQTTQDNIELQIGCWKCIVHATIIIQAASTLCARDIRGLFLIKRREPTIVEQTWRGNWGLYR
jgi:hypothetical protein